jgi:hypothetical protein
VRLLLASFPLAFALHEAEADLLDRQRGLR